MNAHPHILFAFSAATAAMLAVCLRVVAKLARLLHPFRPKPLASLWKRAASIEPHLRPPVGGIVIRQVAIHVSRRHHAPLPKEPGKLWR
jgi:hypothetical protein